MTAGEAAPLCAAVGPKLKEPAGCEDSARADTDRLARAADAGPAAAAGSASAASALGASVVAAADLGVEPRLTGPQGLEPAALLALGAPKLKEPAGPLDAPAAPPADLGDARGLLRTGDLPAEALGDAGCCCWSAALRAGLWAGAGAVATSAGVGPGLSLLLRRTLPGSMSAATSAGLAPLGLMLAGLAPVPAPVPGVVPKLNSFCAEPPSAEAAGLSCCWLTAPPEEAPTNRDLDRPAVSGLALSAGLDCRPERGLRPALRPVLGRGPWGSASTSGTGLFTWPGAGATAGAAAPSAAAVSVPAGAAGSGAVASAAAAGAAAGSTSGLTPIGRLGMAILTPGEFRLPAVAFSQAVKRATAWGSAPGVGPAAAAAAGGAGGVLLLLAPLPAAAPRPPAAAAGSGGVLLRSLLRPPPAALPAGFLAAPGPSLLLLPPAAAAADTLLPAALLLPAAAAPVLAPAAALLGDLGGTGILEGAL